jgi:hypothetical protein
MANRLWPADAISGAPAYSGRALRQTQSPFTAGATPARPLGARSGVRPGTSTATVTATATAWTCGPHAGLLDVETAAEAGPYTYAVDTSVTGAITASNASNPRVDLIYVQVTDAAEDGAAPGQPAVVTVGYLAGTASASPVAPALPARSIGLARINVPKTGGGNPTVQWIAPYAVGAGGLLPVWDQAERDALTKTEPLLVWRLDKHWAELWNGSGWEVIGTHAERDTYFEWNSGSTGIGGGNTFRAVSIPASPQAQRVRFMVSGLVSPDAQGDAGIAVTALGGTVVQNPQVRIFTSIGGQFYGYSRSGYVSIPANASAEIRFTNESSVTARYQVTVETHTLAAGQF